MEGGENLLDLALAGRFDEIEALVLAAFPGITDPYDRWVITITKEIDEAAKWKNAYTHHLFGSGDIAYTLGAVAGHAQLIYFNRAQEE